MGGSIFAGASQDVSPNQTHQVGSSRDAAAEHPDAGWTPFEASQMFLVLAVCMTAPVRLGVACCLTSDITFCVLVHTQYLTVCLASGMSVGFLSASMDCYCPSGVSLGPLMHLCSSV